MKKITKLGALLVCAAFAFSFWSCDNGNNPETPTQEEQTNTEKEKSESGTKEGGSESGAKEEGSSAGESKEKGTKEGGASEGSGAGEGGASDGTETALTANTALQKLITDAKEGGSVTLTAGATGTGTYISINKALTVDGSNIEGLTVVVSPNLTSKVTLKNFKKAKVKVGTVDTAARFISHARGAEEPGKDDVLPPPVDVDNPDGAPEEHLKTIGDDALPIQIEGCTFETFETEKEIALYMESGEKKSEIEELKIKEGAEDFTFIELDKDETKLEEKSKVGDLIIEDGVEKVSLVGGTFDDVNLADDFSGKVDFKYDKEFEDQFGEEFDKEKFFEDSKIEEMDVAIADNNETKLSGVWKLELNKTDLDYFNGYVSIVFLNETQVKILTRQAPYDDESKPIETYAYELFNAENPIYCLTSFGDFKYDSESKESLRTVFGSEPAIWVVSGYDEFGQPEFGQINFDQYPNYRRESVVVKVTDEKVTYYVNLDEIMKSDLLIGANTEKTPIGGPGSKLSAIDLAGYKPYFAVDFGKFCDVWNSSEDVAVKEIEAPVDAQSMNGYEMWADGALITDGENAGQYAPYLDKGGSLYNHITSEALSPKKAMGMSGTPLYIPVYDTVQFAHGMPRFFFFDMEDASEEKYPDVSTVEYSNINVVKE